MITTIVLIKADPKRIPEAAIKLAGIEGVQEVYSVSGEWDLVAIVKVAEYEQPDGWRWLMVRDARRVLGDPTAGVFGGSGQSLQGTGK